MRPARKVQPNGVVEFRTFEGEDGNMVSVVIPHGVAGGIIDIEFRLHDFIAFADYTADIADKIIKSETVSSGNSSHRNWLSRLTRR
jgi:hypothetical protein